MNCEGGVRGNGGERVSLGDNWQPERGRDLEKGGQILGEEREKKGLIKE